MNDPVPTHEEEMRLQQQMDRDLKLLPERKRRTFLRKLERNEEGTKFIRVPKCSFYNSLLVSAVLNPGEDDEDEDDDEDFDEEEEDVDEDGDEAATDKKQQPKTIDNQRDANPTLDRCGSRGRRGGR